MKENQAVKVNGVKIYPFTNFDEIVDFVVEKPGLLVAINARKIHSATDETRAIIDKSIGYADGIGAVAALKQCGVKNAVKIAGCELWLKIIERLCPQGKKFYLIGSTQEVIDIVVNKLKRQFPQICIEGYRNGFFRSNEEREQLLNDIAEKKPDVVFVAMGSPLQELFMAKMQTVNPGAIYQGLGGSFNVYAGHFKRAPQWFIKHNLEGVYRTFADLSMLQLKRAWLDIVYISKLKLGLYPMSKTTENKAVNYGK